MSNAEEMYSSHLQMYNIVLAKTFCSDPQIKSSPSEKVLWESWPGGLITFNIITVLLIVDAVMAIYGL